MTEQFYSDRLTGSSDAVCGVLKDGREKDKVKPRCYPCFVSACTVWLGYEDLNHQNSIRAKILAKMEINPPNIIYPTMTSKVTRMAANFDRGVTSPKPKVVKVTIL